MRPTDANIQRFSDWLLGRGRSVGTAELYASNVGCCYDDSRGPTARLVREGLAPKTKRTNLAALRAWSKFTGDGKLLEKLEDLKLPPPERVTEKRPVTMEQWHDVLDGIATLNLPPAEENAVEMICLRGFRVGDVCRLTKRSVREGVRTGLLNYKGKSARQIEWTVRPFEDQLLWFAEQTGWKTVSDLIAPTSSTHRRYKGARQKLYRHFADLAVLAGLDDDELTPHRLRRTYAVYFLDEVGGDLEKLRQHMGWASIATAAQYVDHSRREELDQVADGLAARRSR